ncbi:uncharacterized protein PV09_01476 [Verruconis gallopava]|uniref:Carbohydrate-binding domain-containing protein n=1 Tax=Verruconis gallopava TaxID=253628 RepID=A0A0D1XXQ0_9PEZI|nr:uncharacterized protein PV09_01476 [Verruconis gallopava]KIW07511.1 hypothetical protein PV09_01476 [Verruconis gallopava]
MLSYFLKWAIMAVAVSAAVPSLDVPACPFKSMINYDKSVPDLEDFPLTQVELCYSAQYIHINFTAYNETSFFYNSSYGTNDPIYNYEVMEVFVYHGKNDPQTYLEFEVAPNNVTFNSFIYNPSKIRAAGAPFDRFYISEPVVDGLTASTMLDKLGQTWKSSVRIPLALFNVDSGQAKGTLWRMNFFRTVVSPKTFPNQLLGAWSVPNAANFHMTPFFGYVKFV